MIHIVKSPFYCRDSQFEPGKRQLVVGVDLKTLEKNPSYSLKVGNNRRYRYDIDKNELLLKGKPWKNPRGKTVIIIPLDYFTKVDEKPEIMKQADIRCRHCCQMISDLNMWYEVDKYSVQRLFLRCSCTKKPYSIPLIKGLPILIKNDRAREKIEREKAQTTLF